MSNPTNSELTSVYPKQSLDDQPRVSDFLPRHLPKIVLVITSLGLVAGGIVTLRLYASEIAPWVASSRLTAITTTTAGSLSAWFSSFVFGLASLVCFATYSLRRHRIDDYKGRYRVWRTAGIACLLAGLSVSTGLHLALGDALIRLASIQGGLLKTLAWLAPATALFGPVLLRVMLDLRESRLALTAATAAHGAWLLALLIEGGLIHPSGPAPLIAMSSLLGGHTLLLAALLLNARHVTLQASGKLAAPVRRRKKEGAKSKRKKDANNTAARKADASSRSNGQDDSPEAATARSNRQVPGKRGQIAVDSAHDEPRRPVISRQAASSPPAAQTDDDRWIDAGEDDYDEYGDSDRSLSKSERKRLRKQKARAQRSARK